MPTDTRIETIKEYFRRIDSRDPSLADLYSDNVELWFPKFGTARGKAAVAGFGAVLGAHLKSLTHDIERFRYHVSGDVIVVEGTESGVAADGTVWPDGEVSEGRFCNVFEFEGDLIRAARIYVDPDFTSAHTERIRQLRR